MFATGITIVTARSGEGTPVGVTISSFNSVSLTPPLVLWSMGHQTSSLPVFSQCTHYAIHVLTVGQRLLAERFATRGVDRWAGVAWQESADGVPLIEGSAAIFECRNRSQYIEGDHTLFVGEVARCQHRKGSAPLLYHGGMFYSEHPIGRIAPSAVRPAHK